jgi:hypothetical protein
MFDCFNRYYPSVKLPDCRTRIDIFQVVSIPDSARCLRKVIPGLNKSKYMQLAADFR